MSLRKALCIGLVSGNLIGLFAVPLALHIIDISTAKRATVATGSTTASSVTTIDAVTSQPAIMVPLVVNELLVDPVYPQTDAADEFIELFNPNGQPLVLTGYVLKVSNSSYTLPATTIPAGGFIAITSAVSHLSLVNTGGSITLSDAAGGQVIQIAWAQSVAGASWAHFNDGWHWTGTPTSAAANTLKLVGAEATAAVQVAAATPKPSAAPTITPVSTPSAAPSPTPVSTPTPVATLTPTPSPTPVATLVDAPAPGFVEAAAAVVPPIITELLPDPVAPDTDAAAEFIELYNSSDEPFNLNGYSLRTGKSLGNHYTFGTLILESGQYYYLTSAVSKLGLANAGSSVALFDPAGAQVDETISYDAAKPGQSWAFDGSVWGWSTTPTPGTINLVTSPAVAVPTATAVKAAAASSAKKATTTTKKVTAAKAAAIPKAKAVKAAKTVKLAKPLIAGTSTGGGRWLLFVLAGLTIGYIIYEFRHDLRNYYHTAIRDPRLGGTAGKAAPRRRDDRTGERLGRRQDDVRAGVGPRPVIQW